MTTMEPQDSDFLCGNWVWDSFLHELRFYERRGKGWQQNPLQSNRLRPVTSVTWHKWAQAPSPNQSGQTLSGQLSKILIQFKGDDTMTINERDRECASKLAQAIATSYDLAVKEVGAPGNRLLSALPKEDELGRLINHFGNTELIIDRALGEITEISKRLLLRKKRRLPFSDVRKLECCYTVIGLTEDFSLTAIYGENDQRLLIANHHGFEGWHQPSVWMKFAQSIAQTIGRVEIIWARETLKDPNSNGWW